MGRISTLAVLTVTVVFSTSCKVSPEQRLDRGNLALASEKFDDAVTELAKGLEESPENARLHERLGFALFRRRAAGDLERSEAEYRRALELDGSLGSAHVGLGNLLWEAGRKDEAKREYEAFLHRSSPVDDPFLVLERARITALLVEERRLDRGRDSASSLDAP